jgi:hypothetical protein
MKWVMGMLAMMLVAMTGEARAEEETQPAAKKEPLPSVFLNMGGGYAGPSVPSAIATPDNKVGQILFGDLHVFPISTVRELGFVVRGEITVLSTKDFFGSSAPAIYSVLGGPELQTRTGVLILRGGVLAGMRAWSDGVMTYMDPRVLITMQTDFVLHKESEFTPIVGFFGGVDVYPGIGWNAGATISIAVF